MHDLSGVPIVGATVDPLSGPHVVSRILHESVYYPAHSPRAESAAYRKVHDHMVHELDLPCQVCGVKASTLGDKMHNRVGAQALETHHHVVEWALANAVDLAKFNERIVARHRANPHHDPIYDTDFTQQQLLDWVDHHPDNLWVLCDVHHRHQLVGIHAVTYPIWGVQDLLSDSYKYTPGNVQAAAKRAALWRSSPDDNAAAQANDPGANP